MFSCHCLHTWLTVLKVDWHDYGFRFWFWKKGEVTLRTVNLPFFETEIIQLCTENARHTCYSRDSRAGESKMKHTNKQYTDCSSLPRLRRFQYKIRIRHSGNRFQENFSFFCFGQTLPIREFSLHSSKTAKRDFFSQIFQIFETWKFHWKNFMKTSVANLLPSVFLWIWW